MGNVNIAVFIPAQSTKQKGSWKESSDIFIDVERRWSGATMELGRQRTLILGFIHITTMLSIIPAGLIPIPNLSKKPHQHHNTTNIERKHKWIQSKTKTEHTAIFLPLLPKHSPQRRLGTTQQRNAQRKPTRYMWQLGGYGVGAHVGVVFVWEKGCGQ